MKTKQEESITMNPLSVQSANDTRIILTEGSLLKLLDVEQKDDELSYNTFLLSEIENINNKIKFLELHKNFLKNLWRSSNGLKQKQIKTHGQLKLF